MRWAFFIATGEETEEIIKKDKQLEDKLEKASKEQMDEILKEERPLHTRMKYMQMQISKVKQLLGKTKELKDELKIDIEDANSDIDMYIE